MVISKTKKEITLLKIGDKAPDFTLPNADNNSVSLIDFSGKKVVLWFYPKASTPGWTMEGKGFRDEFHNFENNNIQILGCSADSPKKQKKFTEKQAFQYPILCDENHEMLIAYGVWGKKKFMGREYKGIYRTTFIIDEEAYIERVYKKVKINSHALSILNDLQWILSIKQLRHSNRERWLYHKSIILILQY